MRDVLSNGLGGVEGGGGSSHPSSSERGRETSESGARVESPSGKGTESKRHEDRALPERTEKDRKNAGW